MPLAPVACRAPPRARGGNLSGDNPQIGVLGSSPRARRQSDRPSAAVSSSRLLPARADDTTARSSGTDDTTAPPRARGRHISAAFYAVTPWGSSPRARTTLQKRKPSTRILRLLPARADDTTSISPRSSCRTTSPRARGRDPDRRRRPAGKRGSSPRARTGPRRTAGRGCGLRLLPARADGTQRHEASPLLRKGSSPRARTGHGTFRPPRTGDRLLPARADGTRDASG